MTSIAYVIVFDSEAQAKRYVEGFRGQQRYKPVPNPWPTYYEGRGWVVEVRDPDTTRVAYLS